MATTVTTREERAWRSRLHARLDHLQSSSRLLSTLSPTVAAYLGSQQSKLIFAHTHEYSNADALKGRESRREVCGKCGSIMIPGRTCAVRSQAVADKVSKKKATLSKDLRIVYQCHRCEAKTYIAAPTRYPTVSRKKLRAGQEPAAAPSAEKEKPPQSKATGTVPTLEPAQVKDKKAPEAPTSANSRSKERAKARKGGLQAMLQKNKQQSSQQSGFGLDLMDLMRPG